MNLEHLTKNFGDMLKGLPRLRFERDCEGKDETRMKIYGHFE